MFLNRILTGVVFIFVQRLHHSCDENFEDKYSEGRAIALDTKDQFYKLFDVCYRTTMPRKKFISNNIHSYINYPSKTTVGYSPKFTSNRKFFANMIGTVAFKNMVEEDIQELKKDLIKKMKYCDESVLDQTLLKEYYDREVDLSKL